MNFARESHVIASIRSQNSQLNNLRPVGSVGRASYGPFVIVLPAPSPLPRGEGWRQHAAPGGGKLRPHRRLPGRLFAVIAGAEGRDELWAGVRRSAGAGVRGGGGGGGGEYAIEWAAERYGALGSNLLDPT